MSAITTHILDVARGRPAGGVPVVLEHSLAGAWTEIGRGETDADGRLKNLLPVDFALAAGTYRLTFDTSNYFSAQQTESFYPAVTVTFIVRDGAEHYHVPLLLSPFGYS
ncbi:MAG TPA: hydroxyisourate hydrolase, partial [Pyrinomonadaceae bacterium]